MNKSLFFIIIFCLIVFQFYGKQAKIDSLENLLPNVEGIEKIRLLNTLSSILKESSPKECIKYSKQAVKIANELNDLMRTGDPLYDIGIAFYYLNQYDSAEFYYKKSLEAFILSGNELETDNIYNNLGNLYNKTGQFAEALDNHHKALSVREIKGNRMAIGYSYNNLGLIYMKLNNYDEAISYIEKSTAIWKEIGNRNAYLFCINNLGIIYYEKDSLVKSLECHIEALEIEKELNCEKNMALTLNNIGIVYIELDSFERSLHYFLNSLKLKREFKNKYSIANTLSNIGKNYICLNEPKLAKKYLDESLELAEEVKALQYVEENFLHFAILAASKQNMDEAYLYLDKYKELKDSSFIENTSSKIAKIESKHEKEKRIKEIEILKREAEIERVKVYRQKMAIYGFFFVSLLIAFFSFVLMKQLKNRKKAYNLLNIQKNEIEEKNSELKFRQTQIVSQNSEISSQRLKYIELNATKDKFFSIIAHDLKSPFNSIIGFSELLATEIDQYDMDELKRMATFIHQSSRETYNLLSNLLEWSRTQTDNIAYRPKNFEINKILEDVLLLLSQNATEKEINIISKIYKPISVFADKNMIETVLRNLLSNAIKFTNIKGQIEIQIYEMNDFVEVQITDNGIGIKASNIDRLFRIDESFSTRGTKKEEGTGLGLIICKEFIEKNEGKIWVKSVEGEGSTFYFMIKKAS
ncbi:MAG: tetratricopeptide repeat-containing sensor histidine kinase [Bacteroidetes bacterium]|jgi:signal transduction histidine kinase/Tfp pilus assembly protein PilF|nr:tetratricopeptide repeat-containing sensor histidine kinase [Bacteroidota bacterium]MBT6686000.1 tetratricopeptide repeat-containing sensor histidine kinase [Bacteroidota bacterium]MBT7143782.1 tetratricopeptide repeat-containing sensor histidine kinase [Bacteroidota bacterium]MBT7490881.1 tetratricopeptide repeat-containing sensor histidine kinase [Bacteroidota bacterium]